MDTSFLGKAFDSDFPALVREALLIGAITTYPAAWEATRAFSKPTAKWLQPLHRHALMRDTFGAVARRFDGINPIVRKTRPATTTYVELRSGTTVLTASAVHYAKEVPRWAKHRENYSQAVNVELFDENDPGSTPSLYAILLCGPDVTHGRVQHVPTFIDVGIPAKDLSEYVQYWQLYDEFPGSVEETVGVTPSEIRRAYIALRRLAKEEGDAS